MIEIFVDGIQLEVPQDTSIGLNLGIADYADPITASGAYTQTIEVPRTPHNDKVFRFSGEVLSAEKFNHSEHTARVVENGCELVEGRAFLEGVTQLAYNVQIVGTEIEWVESIRDKKLSEIEGDTIGSYQPSDWSELEGVSAEALPQASFVLMQHGHWYNDTDNKPMPRTWATYNDLIPIVKLHTILAHCFKGYNIVASEALRKALHQTYVTTKWKTDDKAKYIEEDMGFELSSKLLYADSNGEVTATITPDKRVARLQAFDTIEEDKNGVLDRGYDEEGWPTIELSPTQEVAMAYELKARYHTTTAFSTTELIDDGYTWSDVSTNNEPAFADQLHNKADEFPFVKLNIKDSLEWANKLQYSPDERSTWKAIELNLSLNIPDANEIVAATSPDKMALAYIEVAKPEIYTSVGYYVQYEYEVGDTDYGDGTYKGGGFYRPTQNFVQGENFVRSNFQKGVWEEIFSAGDMALKWKLLIVPALRGADGYIYIPRNAIGGPSWSDDLRVLNDNAANFYLVSEDQRLTFDVALKTPTRRLLPGYAYEVSPLLLSSSYNGDEPITVYATEGGSLKPSFDWGVPIREGVKLSDIGGDTSAEDMVRSIMQLYNLVIYTNPKTKEVALYSLPEFWQRNIVDWSRRIDHDKDISVSAMGDTIGKSITLHYADGNPRIDYYNDRHDMPYFGYKHNLSTKMATEKKEVGSSFSPAYMVKVAEEFEGGEGVIPAVADKDKEGNALDFNLADVPHTLVLIPEGNELSETPTLPIDTTVFGDIGSIQPPMTDAIAGVTTLSFADKDGIEGLHKHYDKQIALWEKAKRLTCYCRVEAWEIEALRYNAENINFRSLFHLNIKGEDIYGRLESIEYEPSNTTNKCVFIIE